MKRLFISLILGGAMAIAARAAVDIPLTSVTYDVVYHWGLIDKVAGTGFVRYHTMGDIFEGQLQGRSIPWGGRIYTVRSSLSAQMSPGAQGIDTENITALQGIYTKPREGSDPATAPFKNIYGEGTLDASGETMEAVSVMSDMIGMFYYARSLDFPSFAPGHRIEVPIIKGGASQPLYITYQGEATYSYNGYTAPAYEIVFQYTYNGVPDRYPVTCLIDKNSRVPVQFKADLVIGHIEMCYVP